MPEIEKLQKHTLFLYEGDFDKLASFFPDLPKSKVVRTLVHEAIKKLEANLPQLPKDLDKLQ